VFDFNRKYKVKYDKYPVKNGQIPCCIDIYPANVTFTLLKHDTCPALIFAKKSKYDVYPVLDGIIPLF
jgi:hypothetical protein